MASSGSHGSSHGTPTAPAAYQAPGSLTNFIWIATFLGVLALAFGLATDKIRTLHAVVLCLFYFTSLSLGGLFFTAIQHVTKAGWSVTTRRVAEAFTAFLPYSMVIGLVFAIFGAPSLYKWMNHDLVAGDELLQKKASYLNGGFFIARCILFYAIWFLFKAKIVGNSLKQDKDGKESWTHSNLKWSIPFLISFAFTYSLFSVDLIMSLDPHWFSTIFGVYTFAGLFQSSIAFMILVTVHLMKRGYLTGFVNENHLHDLGKLLFAFTVFYAYIAFSQFMLIWYANIPEETVFFLERGEGMWLAVSYSLPVFKFVVPFLLLLPRAAKRNEAGLVRISILLLVMQFVDVYWLVYPNFNGHHPLFSLQEVGIFAGFLGLFLLSVTKFLSKNSLIPMKDPRLQEAMNHHI